MKRYYMLFLTGSVSASDVNESREYFDFSGESDL